MEPQMQKQSGVCYCQMTLTKATSKMAELTLCTECLSWEIWEIMKIFDCDTVFIVNRYIFCFSYGGS